MRHFSVFFFIIILIQTGYYLYVESSGTTPGQTTPGKRAELVSPWLSGRPGGRCLKFNYFMYGKIVGSLAVKLINVIRRKELVHFSQAKRSRQRLEKGNREHRSSDAFKVQGKYIPEILTLYSCGLVVILVDLIQLELLSYFSRDKEKGDQNVLK